MSEHKDLLKEFILTPQIVLAAQDPSKDPDIHDALHLDNVMNITDLDNMPKTHDIGDFCSKLHKFADIVENVFVFELPIAKTSCTSWYVADQVISGDKIFTTKQYAILAQVEGYAFLHHSIIPERRQHVLDCLNQVFGEENVTWDMTDDVNIRIKI